MARQVQIFTRLLPEKVEALEEIGRELAAEGEETVKSDGEVNCSEVIRILLAKADRRLA